MSTPMRRVNEVMSSKMGDYLTNFKTWGGVMYNVLENRLIGDGTTDDTAALQTLINTAIAAGRKAIYFPHTETGGEYYVTALTNADQVEFIGDNASFVGGYAGEIKQFGDWATTAQLTDMAVDLRSYATGDGSDETAEVQAALDYITDNNKTLLIPEGYTFVVDGLTITGKSFFTIQGLGVLKRKTGATPGNILLITDSSDFNIINYNSDGNISGNGGTVDEASNSLRLFNCSNFNIGTVSDRNPSSDSLTIRECSSFTVGSVLSVSDGFTGRNGLTIGGNVRDFVISKVVSINTGYSTMPGGVDIEPDLPGEVVENGCITYAVVRTGGTNGIAVVNTVGATIRNLEVNGYVEKDNSSNAMFIVWGVDHFRGRFTGECLTNRSIGCSIDNASNVTLDLDLKNAGTAGVQLGQNQSVDKFRLTGYIDGVVDGSCITIVNANEGVIDMNLKNPKTGSFVINKNASGTSDNIIFRGDYSKDSTGSYCFFAGGTVTNWMADKVDMSGWGNDNRVRDTSTQFEGNFRAFDCPGLNFAAASPTFDVWTIGAIVKNTAPTVAKNIEYWKCVANGEAGTWNAVGVGTGDTASRPALNIRDKGFLYFDTTVTKLMYWDGSAYV